MAKFKDLTNEVFEMLKVLERDLSKKRTYWICECDCGNKTSVRQDSLKSGRVVSCGCYHKNIASKKSTNKKYNEYEVCGDVAYLKTSNGDIIKVDLEDLDKINNYCWSKNSVGYAQAREIGKDSIVLMHRIIMSPSNKELVDHINHDKLDNRKLNLRVCSQSDNMANQIISKTNTTGFKGVYWDDNRNKWVSQIGYKNKNIYLGRYDNKQDAIEAREKAEIEYFGEYRYKEW